MGNWYPFPKKWEQNIVVILNIYGARSMFLLFCDHQDTEYESCGIYMSISQPIFTYNKISNYIWNNNIYSVQYGRKYCGNYSYSWSLSHVPTI